MAIQDTTEMDFTPMKTVTDLGPLNDDTRRGFYMHGHYVVSEQGLPLGVLGADIILRDDEDFRQAAKRRNLPIEEKESHRWIEGYCKACELARDLPDTEVISVSDRESDIFELYLEWLNSEGSRRAEWKSACAVVKRPPKAGEPSLREFICIIGIIGKLGGHLGRKSDGDPGPQVIWRRLSRVRDLACVWRAIHEE